MTKDERRNAGLRKTNDEGRNADATKDEKRNADATKDERRNAGYEGRKTYLFRTVRMRFAS